MNKKSVSLIGFLFLFLFLLLANRAQAACGGALPSSSCDDGGHSLSSSASPWPRTMSLSDGLFLDCSSGTECEVTKCSPLAVVRSDFSTIDLSSSAVGPSRIFSWTCTETSCNCPAGDSHYACWCSNYAPNYGIPSCGASAQISDFNDQATKQIYNLPVSVVGGDWNYCGPGAPSTTDPTNPLPGGGRNRISACIWSNRPPDSCSSIKEHQYEITDNERTFTCNAMDMDGTYDNLRYSFRLKELGGAEINCSTNWLEVSGGWCRQASNGGNQVIFRSSDPLAQYQMTCEATDDVGSTDYSYNLIKVGSNNAVSCALYPERIAVCAGESTKVRTETHPDSAGVAWSCTNGQSGANKDFLLTFTNAHVGARAISMTATSGGLSANCNSTVSVLGSSCDVNLEPLNGVNLGALVPGSRVKIIADPSCFVVAAGDAYRFVLTKDGGNAVRDTDYRDISGVTVSSQAIKNVTIEIINPGQYGVNLTINKSGGGTVACSNEFLANTSATEWWERRP